MKKKIFLYIDSMQFGGAQRVMNIIAEYLVNHNYQVTLINDIIPSNVEPEYSINKKIKRYYLDQGNPFGNMKNLYRIKRLRKLIQKDKPDIILSFLGPPNIRSLIATLGLKIKTVVSVRNDPFQEYGTGLHRFIARTAFRFANGCVFQTKEASTYFPISVQRKSKIIVNPVNDKFYDVEWTGKNKEIAVVGRLQPQKNPILALEAFNMIAKDFPDYKLVYYGDEELKNDIIRKSKGFGIESQVVIYGKTDKIEEKLASSTVYLLSSDYEGMPNALLEAMAVGVPAIATDCPCGGPRMIIENKKQGILVPCGDSIKMANALRCVLANEQFRRTLSKNEITRADSFRNDKVMRQWIDFINI